MVRVPCVETLQVDIVDILEDNNELDLFCELYGGILGDNNCKNYTIDKLNSHITSTSKDLSVLHLNTRSLFTKLDE